MVKKLKLMMDFIKIEHTLFALPFAYLGAFMAKEGMISAEKIVLIATAFTGFRTAAMSLNRIIDREIDALNPRTANRHLPAGLISLREAYAVTALSLTVYFISAYLINQLAFLLSPIPAITAYIYPYLKRYTTLSHYVLGLNLAYAPMGGWIAITGSFDIFGKDFLPFLIGIAVIFWVAGFDIIYAIQDYEFDVKHGIHSIPAKYGIQVGKIISAANHVIFFSLLSTAILFVHPSGPLAIYGLILTGLILIAEHAAVWLLKEERFIQISFFYLNASLSSVLLATVILDIFL